MSQIEDVIKSCVGEGNAVKSKELEERYDCSGAEIREAVNAMRKKGVPICSSSRGYYYASSVADIDRSIANLNSRAKNINEAKRGLMKAKRKIEKES